MNKSNLFWHLFLISVLVQSVSAFASDNQIKDLTKLQQPSISSTAQSASGKVYANHIRERVQSPMRYYMNGYVQGFAMIQFKDSDALVIEQDCDKDEKREIEYRSGHINGQLCNDMNTGVSGHNGDDRGFLTLIPNGPDDFITLTIKRKGESWLATTWFYRVKYTNQ